MIRSTRLARAAVVAALLAGATCASTTPARTPDRPRRTRAPAAAPVAPADAAPVAERATPTDTADAAAPAVDAAPAARPATVPGSAEEGVGSFYADLLAGNRTASGERYRPRARTCAHKTHPFGTILVVTALDSGRTATCRVNDRGPWVRGRIVDVSGAVADTLGMRRAGVLKVRVEVAADGEATQQEPEG